MTIVIDTSAAIEMLLQRARRSEVEKRIAESEWVIAPELFISEAANVFWKLHRFSNLPIDQCETYLSAAVAIPDDFFSASSLYKEAFALACLCQIPVYDSMFLALARRENATLLTIDTRLNDIAVKHSIKCSGA